VLPITRVADVDLAGSGIPRVGVIVAARDGGVVVAVPHDEQIAVIGPNGKIVQKIGGAGSGKGQFTGLGALGWVGDTLWAADNELKRITLFSPAGFGVARVVPAVTAAIHGPSGDVEPFPLALRPGALVALYPNGSGLYNALIGAGSVVPADWHRPSGGGPGILLRADAAGRYRQLIEWLDPTFCSPGVPTLFCPRLLSSVSADGGVVADAYAPTAGADSGAMIVTVRDGNGRVLYTRRYPMQLTALTSRDADSLMRRYAVPGKASGSAGAFHPTIYAPLQAIIATRDSSVWIGERTTAAGTRWLLLDAIGKLRGAVLLPPGVRLRAADRGALWATEGDGTPQPHLIRYVVTLPR
jgi:hypothetical protein